MPSFASLSPPLDEIAVILIFSQYVLLRYCTLPTYFFYSTEGKQRVAYRDIFENNNSPPSFLPTPPPLQKSLENILFLWAKNELRRKDMTKSGFRA